MLTPLERSRIGEYVGKPGVTILDWRHPGVPISLLFDQVLERAPHEHEDVRFGAVDVSKDRALAREWEVSAGPTVMGYRASSTRSGHSTWMNCGRALMGRETGS